MPFSGMRYLDLMLGISSGKKLKNVGKFPLLSVDTFAGDDDDDGDDEDDVGDEMVLTESSDSSNISYFSGGKKFNKGSRIQQRVPRGKVLEKKEEVNKPFDHHRHHHHHHHHHRHRHHCHHRHQY